jgi:hypothetical protein
MKQIVSALCAIIFLALSFNASAQTATTNTGKTASVSEQFYGFNAAANRFDSLYMEVTVENVQKWTDFHIRVVGGSGVYMANNFANYNAAAGTVSRKGHVLTLTPAFEGVSTITLHDLNPPRLAVREIGTPFGVHYAEGADSTTLYLRGGNGSVTWTASAASTFSLSVHDSENRSRLYDTARAVYEPIYQKWLDGGMTGDKPTMPDIPYDVRKTITLPKVGAKKIIEAYGRNYEVIRLR